MITSEIEIAKIKGPLKDLYAVIYLITGLGSTIGQMAEFIPQTDVGADTICPELAIAALAKGVYSAGDEAYEIVTKIHEHLDKTATADGGKKP